MAALGVGHVYMLLWIIGISLYLYYHFTRIYRGTKELWVNPVMDYASYYFCWVCIPLGLALGLVNFEYLPEAVVLQVHRENIALINWMREAPYFKIIPVLRAEDLKEGLVIYSTSLSFLYAHLLFILAVPLVWPVSQSWLNFFERRESKSDAIIYCLISSLCLFLLGRSSVDGFTSRMFDVTRVNGIRAATLNETDIFMYGFFSLLGMAGIIAAASIFAAIRLSIGSIEKRRHR